VESTESVFPPGNHVGERNTEMAQHTGESGLADVLRQLLDRPHDFFTVFHDIFQPPFATP
jgi:hypothetical protein